MIDKIPQYLYHYTSINTLGFILENRNIRFNNLSAVDDLNESIHGGIPWGKLCFISSWTDDVSESIPMWKMYSNNLNGVRIRLRSLPFKTYGNEIRENAKVDFIKKFPNLKFQIEVYDFLKHIPKENKNSAQIYDALATKLAESNQTLVIYDNRCLAKNIDDYVVNIQEFPYAHNMNFSHLSLLNKIIYTDMDSIDEIHKQLLIDYEIYKEIDFIYYRIDNLGTFKSDFWEFQKEWRYILRIIPDDIILSKEAPKMSDIINSIPFNDCYLIIDDAAFKDMEIIIGPKANKIDQEIVHMMVERYNPSAEVRLSELHGRIG